jgi:hypothetical protein
MDGAKCVRMHFRDAATTDKRDAKACGMNGDRAIAAQDDDLKTVGSQCLTGTHPGYQILALSAREIYRWSAKLKRAGLEGRRTLLGNWVAWSASSIGPSIRVEKMSASVTGSGVACRSIPRDIRADFRTEEWDSA